MQQLDSALFKYILEDNAIRYTNNTFIVCVTREQTLDYLNTRGDPTLLFVVR